MTRDLPACELSPVQTIMQVVSRVNAIRELVSELDELLDPNSKAATALEDMKPVLVSLATAVGIEVPDHERDRVRAMSPRTIERQIGVKQDASGICHVAIDVGRILKNLPKQIEGVVEEDADHNE